MNYIGIDISENSFHSAKLCSKNGKYQVKECSYRTAEDLANFTQNLDKSNDWCVMEATGVYHLNLAYWLTEHGYQVSVVNPLSVKRYRQMKGSISKTDSQDAIYIAQYAQSESMSLTLFKIPQEIIVQLTHRRMLLNSLQSQLQVVDNQLHALAHHPNPDKFTQEFLNNNKTFLQAQVKEVQRNINQLIDQDYSQQKEILLSIPGFGHTTANVFIETINTFDGIEKDNAIKAFAKFAGLAPTIEQSGKSVRKQATIARSGCPLLRTKLFLPAVTVSIRTKKDNIFKTFYVRLRSAGKSFKEAIVAVMHKMTRVAIALIKSGSMFNTNFSTTK